MDWLFVLVVEIEVVIEVVIVWLEGQGLWSRFQLVVLEQEVLELDTLHSVVGDPTQVEGNNQQGRMDWVCDRTALALRAIDYMHAPRSVGRSAWPGRLFDHRSVEPVQRNDHRISGPGP